jgi:hypothetical protein
MEWYWYSIINSFFYLFSFSDHLPVCASHFSIQPYSPIQPTLSAQLPTSGQTPVVSSSSQPPIVSSSSQPPVLSSSSQPPIVSSSTQLSSSSQPPVISPSLHLASSKASLSGLLFAW